MTDQDIQELRGAVALLARMMMQRAASEWEMERLRQLAESMERR